MTRERTTELSDQEWNALLERDRAEQEADPNNAMNSPLGLDEEARNNLTFVMVTAAFLVISLLVGGWYFM